MTSITRAAKELARNPAMPVRWLGSGVIALKHDFPAGDIESHAGDPR